MTGPVYGGTCSVEKGKRCVRAEFVDVGGGRMVWRLSLRDVGTGDVSTVHARCITMATGGKQTVPPPRVILGEEEEYGYDDEEGGCDGEEYERSGVGDGGKHDTDPTSHPTHPPSSRNSPNSPSSSSSSPLLSKTLTSDSILRSDLPGLLRLRELVSTNRRVVVVGGSHSAWSVVWLLLSLADGGDRKSVV